MIDINLKSIIICGIVRDAEKGLKRNIPVINNLCSCFYDYKIVIFEDNSKDGTKRLLRNWQNTSPNNVYVIMDDSFIDKVVPNSNDAKFNPFFSKRRINKMVTLRNMYLQFVEKKRWSPDYLMVVDLDVSWISLEGILSSFEKDNWDAVTANGFSLSPSFKKRYHDTYALVEYGKENLPQTEKMIYGSAFKFGKILDHRNWIRVYSAFGGLAIYRYETIKGLRYQLIENEDERVEVRCEHFSIYKQMSDRGYDKIYINPSMMLKYQSLTWSIAFSTIKRKFGFGFYQSTNV